MKEKELERLTNLKQIEEQLHRENFKNICGIDEAGRGPLAGPVVVAGVIMQGDSMIEGVNDSKKVSEKKRELLYDKILEEAISYSVAIIGQDVIDEINILNATKESMKASFNNLKVKPDLLLIDAVKLNVCKQERAIIKGDETSYAIACASIVAKVYRDKLMQEYAETYPEYDFEHNMGYGTKKHTQAILAHGVTPIHRLSFLGKLLGVEKCQEIKMRRQAKR